MSELKQNDNFRWWISKPNFFSSEECDEIIKRVEENRLNEAGLKLQSDFTYENTANQIIQHLESL